MIESQSVVFQSMLDGAGNGLLGRCRCMQMKREGGGGVVHFFSRSLFYRAHVTSQSKCRKAKNSLLYPFLCCLLTWACQFLAHASSWEQLAIPL